MNRHPVLIVSAQDAESANNGMVELTGNPADISTFDVPLFTADAKTPSHYMAALELNEEDYDKVSGLIARFADARLYSATLDDHAANKIAVVVEATFNERDLKREKSTIEEAVAVESIDVGVKDEKK